MNNQVSIAANKFTIYNQLGLFAWLKFRYLLQPISRDETSLGLLVNFEQKLHGKPLSSRRVEKTIFNCLSWYNREVNDPRISNRMTRTKLPEMLQVLFVFLETSRSLHLAYRDLVLSAVNTIDKLGKEDEACTNIPPQQFLVEYEYAITGLSRKWCANREINCWERWLDYLEREALHLLEYLEIIATRVGNAEQLTKVTRDIAPVIGLQEASLLLAVSEDFQKFSSFYNRITLQLNWWKLKYSALFPSFHSASKVDQCLTFLESLTSDLRMSKCVQYADTHFPGTGLIPLETVRDICTKREWSESSQQDQIIDEVIERFEQNIVASYLSTVWYQYSGLGSRPIHWEFNKFTEYIPYEYINIDWTQYNDKYRYYWNSDDIVTLEYHRYIDELQPRLCKVFRKLSQKEIENLFYALPSHFRLEQYTRIVDVPVEWQEDMIWEEGYEKWVGFYDKQVKVARPKKFKKHIFTFERPDLQEAINTLDNILS